MLLRNYYNILAGIVLGVDGADASKFADGYLNIKRMSNGAIYGLSLNGTNYYAKMLTLGSPSYTAAGNGGANSNPPRFLFGTGTTPVTYDDYKLENEYTQMSKASIVVSNAPVYDSEPKKYTKTVTCVLTNTGSTEVTLREVGIAMDVRGTSGSELVLVYREILDTSITIAAGDAVQYTHTFEFTVPTVG